MTPEQWTIENRRLDQQIIDQQNENAINRQVIHQSLLISKKNAKAYEG